MNPFLEELCRDLIAMDNPIIPDKYLDDLTFMDWNYLTVNVISETFYRNYSDKINWYKLSTISVEPIHTDSLPNQHITEYKESVSEEFIRENFSKLDPIIACAPSVSEKFIREYYEKCDKWVLLNPNLTHLFFRKYPPFKLVSCFNNLRSKYIRSFMPNFTLTTIRDCYLNTLKIRSKYLLTDF